jgi:hypothetical protein
VVCIASLALWARSNGSNTSIPQIQAFPSSGGSADGRAVATITPLQPTLSGPMYLEIVGVAVTNHGTLDLSQTWKPTSVLASDPIQVPVGNWIVTATLAKGTWADIASADVIAWSCRSR